MRIQQNGQSNILLDNLESIETHLPVIYKRRERLLDEELNDGKDIITSKESNAAAAVEAWQGSAAPHENVALQPVLEPQVEAKETDKQAAQLEENAPIATATAQAAVPESGAGAAAAAAAMATVATATSPKHSANSSSLSDAIDYQESVLLRRQQLNRVAEWVQHNTQQLEQRALQPTANLPSDSNSGTERQSSYSTLDHMDSISIEKLSMDSGYKTTPQQLTNGYADAGKSTEDSLSPKTDITSNSLPPELPAPAPAAIAQPVVATKKAELCTTYYRRTTRSGLPVAYTTTTTTTLVADDSAGAGGAVTGGVGAAGGGGTTSSIGAATGAGDSQHCSSSGSPALHCPEQPTCDILNYKYYPNDTDKTRSVQAELHTTTQHVDIAQMEYNVKQFLLKQNEWSMRNEAAGTGAAAGSSKVRHAARHTRLLGPGVGERVRMATPGGAVAATPSSALAAHRTETNL